MIAKVVHDDLNAGGGSERLAVTTIQALNEFGFTVDLESCTPLEFKNLQKSFGISDVHIRRVKKLDMMSLLQLKQQGKEVYDNIGNDGNYYDLVINTHGDLLPYYYYLYPEYKNNAVSLDTYLNYENGDDNTANKNNKRTLMITYCHYPEVPYLTKDRSYMKFLSKFIKVKNQRSSCFDSLSCDSIVIDKLLSNARLLYDLMMKNTLVLTNSEFSKRAIIQLYGNKIHPVVLSPPVDVQAFRKLGLYSKRENQRQNIILVVSRFSPEKKIENAVRVAHILHNNKKIDYKMILVGNISSDEGLDYFESLNNMINECSLKNYVKLEIGTSFERLVCMMSKSKVYLHPLAEEPFGISVAEAMAAGLIPVVPCIGGNSEFVPRSYHYRTLQEAARIIEHALMVEGNSVNYDISRDNQLRTNLSNLTLRFSIENYKRGLKNIVNSLITTTKQKQIQLLDYH